MSMSGIITAAIDHDLYDHPGEQTIMRRAIRRYRDRPALSADETVTIVRFKLMDGQYGPEPRVLVSNANGQERWVAGADIDVGRWIDAPSQNQAAWDRIGEIIRER